MEVREVWGNFVKLAFSALISEIAASTLTIVAIPAQRHSFEVIQLPTGLFDQIPDLHARTAGYMRAQRYRTLTYC